MMLVPENWVLNQLKISFFNFLVILITCKFKEKFSLNRSWELKDQELMFDELELISFSSSWP